MKTELLMKWGFVIPTGEYCGGVLAGVGCGTFIATVILSPEHRLTQPWIWFAGIGCVAVGSLLARSAQRKRFQKNLSDEKPAA